MNSGACDCEKYIVELQGFISTVHLELWPALKLSKLGYYDLLPPVAVHVKSPEHNWPVGMCHKKYSSIKLDE